MKKILAIAMLIAGTMVMVSCGDDDDPVVMFDDVSVTTTSTGTLDNGQTGVTASFSVSVDTDLTATYAVTASNATVTSSASGDVSGSTIDVTFDAGTTAGAVVPASKVLQLELQLSP